MPNWTARDTSNYSDEEYQTYSLHGVSRTFALTIPQLPDPLRLPVGNAYLLCRITDTIEDVASLSIETKEKFAAQFVQAVKGDNYHGDKRDSSCDSSCDNNHYNIGEDFAASFSRELGDEVEEAERDLIKNTARALRLTHGFSKPQRQAIERCVEEMATGMLKFQKQQSLNGLSDLNELNEYCYYVAGVVGVMLTELFCDYSPEMYKHREQMLELAVSFGQGLQMTNILKDIWEDQARGACWLPQDIFVNCQFDLKDIADHKNDECYQLGLEKLIAIARKHLHNAMEYTLLVPVKEKGIRRFCIWAIGMALLTLRNINRQKNFNNGQAVKISRRNVKWTILVTEFIVTSNQRSRWMFRQLEKSLPR